MKDFVKLAEEYSEPFYSKEDPSKIDIKEHIRIVRQLCAEYGKKECADLEVLDLAAILHDIARTIDKENHAIVGAEMAANFLLKEGFNKQRTELVKKCILKHGAKYIGDEDAIEVLIFRSIDGMAVLFDDKLQINNLLKKPKEKILKSIDKKLKKVELKSARKTAEEKAKELKEKLNE